MQQTHLYDPHDRNNGCNVQEAASPDELHFCTIFHINHIQALTEETCWWQEEQIVDGFEIVVQVDHVNGEKCVKNENRSHKHTFEILIHVPHIHFVGLLFKVASLNDFTASSKASLSVYSLRFHKTSIDFFLQFPTLSYLMGVVKTFSISQN